MTPDKIKILLESYYSGDISPDDYETLLSEMKEAKDLPPELENERRILLAVESYEPIIPDSLEKMLSDAIDIRYRKSNNILRLLFSGAAAAVVLICVTIGMLNSGDERLPNSEYIAGSQSEYKEALHGEIATTSIHAEPESLIESVETKSAETTASSEIQEGSVITEINDEELDKAVQIVDESLLNLLSIIHAAQNEVAESFENIQTTHRTNFNN